MAKNTKAISGPAKRKYFRDALSADPGVAADAAKRLTEKFDAELSHMRVRQHVALKGNGKSSPPETLIQPRPELPVATAIAQLSPAAFDPHGFSLIVVMTKQGEAGLRGRLDAIASADNLKALARAQHVAIDTTIDDLATLRSAIIAGTAQRIADRRAAAS